MNEIKISEVNVENLNNFVKPSEQIFGLLCLGAVCGGGCGGGACVGGSGGLVCGGGAGGGACGVGC